MFSRFVSVLTIGFTAFSMLAEGSESDPVLKAKRQRVRESTQESIQIPIGLVDPPPLPPAEAHINDMKKKPVSRKAAKKPAPAKKKSASNTKSNSAKVSAKTSVKKPKAPTKTTKKPIAPAKKQSGAATKKPVGKTTATKKT